MSLALFNYKLATYLIIQHTAGGSGGGGGEVGRICFSLSTGNGDEADDLDWSEVCGILMTRYVLFKNSTCHVYCCLKKKVFSWKGCQMNKKSK